MTVQELINELQTYPLDMEVGTFFEDLNCVPRITEPDIFIVTAQVWDDTLRKFVYKEFINLDGDV